MTDKLFQGPKGLRAKRGRSPSYPGIDLGEALDRAQTLLAKEGRNAAPLGVIFGHWDYGANSGPAMIALAALKKFGLVVDEGSGATRKARLSEDALRILLDEREDSLDRQRTIQKAALRPTIHVQLWGKYGPNLPSDAALKFELQTERAFTKRGADEFIPQFKSTLAFAKLSEGVKLSGEGEDKPPPESEALMTPPTTLQDTPPKPKDGIEGRQPRVYQIPISATESAALQITFPLTAKGWTQMLKVLEAMKSGLVEGHDEPAPDHKDKRPGE